MDDQWEGVEATLLGMFLTSAGNRWELWPNLDELRSQSKRFLAGFRKTILTIC